MASAKPRGNGNRPSPPAPALDRPAGILSKRSSTELILWGRSMTPDAGGGAGTRRPVPLAGNQPQKTGNGIYVLKNAHLMGFAVEAGHGLRRMDTQSDRSTTVHWQGGPEHMKRRTAPLASGLTALALAPLPPLAPAWAATPSPPPDPPPPPQPAPPT